jgi:hypothetical protein
MTDISNPTLTQSLTAPPPTPMPTQKPLMQTAVNSDGSFTGAGGQTYTAAQVSGVKNQISNDDYANQYSMEKYGVPVDYKKQFTDPTWAAAEGGDQAAVRAWIDKQGASTPTPTSPIPGNSVMTDAYRISTTKPTLRTVDANMETTSGQLDRILEQDSPLMQRAQALSLMQANDRGMRNTSMAAGAGTAAMIDAATPIANADAQTYTQASRDNQQYQNASDVFNSQAYNEAQAAGFNASQKLLEIKEQGKLDLGLQTIKNDASVQLAQIEAQYKTVMQSNASAAQVYGDISKNITNIVTSKDIPADQKGAMIAQQTELLRSALAIAGAGSGTDFLKLLDFTGGTGSNKGGTQLPSDGSGPGGNGNGGQGGGHEGGGGGASGGDGAGGAAGGAAGSGNGGDSGGTAI